MFLLRISFLSFLLAGCATSVLSIRELSREQCADIEWQEAGLREGSSGTVESREYQKFVKDCSQYSDLSAEKAAYRRGIEEGLVVYCHAKNAERIGETGAPFFEMNCPSGERASLVQAHKRGLARSDSHSKTSTKQ